MLSSLLCNLYYADFEQHILRPHLQLDSTPHDVNLLMRYTDDFCFFTSSRDQAQTFMALMHRGSKRYGCFVNPRKTTTNLAPRPYHLPHDHPPTTKATMNITTNHTDHRRDSAIVAWCGLLIDCHQMHIYANYRKLCSPAKPNTTAPHATTNANMFQRRHRVTPLALSIVTNTASPLSTWFCKRLVASVVGKCHSIFYAPTLNNHEAVQVYHDDIVSIDRDDI